MVLLSGVRKSRLNRWWWWSDTGRRRPFLFSFFFLLSVCTRNAQTAGHPSEDSFILVVYNNGKVSGNDSVSPRNNSLRQSPSQSSLWTVISSGSHLSIIEISSACLCSCCRIRIVLHMNLGWVRRRRDYPAAATRPAGSTSLVAVTERTAGKSLS